MPDLSLGACIQGLGEKIAAIYATSPELLADLQNSAEHTAELIHHMPLWADYTPSIKSTLADLKNSASCKGAGSITAGLFLKEFVDKTPWAHIDMAGPVWDSEANKPTGFGVKLLVDYLLNKK